MEDKRDMDDMDYEYVPLPTLEPSTGTMIPTAHIQSAVFSPRAKNRGSFKSKNVEDLTKYQGGDLEKRFQGKDATYEEPINLWSIENLAIPCSYMSIGFLLTFPNSVIQFYPRTLGASDSQLSTISTVRALPWNFKLLYGFLSDAVPVAGFHRKPYMLLGYLIFSGGSLMMSMVANPGVITFTLLLLLQTFGLIMADVMADALMATKAKQEHITNQGKIQSQVYLTRFSFEIIGYWLGAVLYNKPQWGWGLDLSQMFLVMTVWPLIVMLPAIYFVEEPRNLEVKAVREQLKTIYDLLSNRAVWRPLSFIFLYSSMMTYNAAWGNFLHVRYHFSAFQYAAMAAVGSIVMFIGVWLYQKFGLRKDIWRQVYLYTTIIISIVAGLNVLLVLNINEQLHIPAYWFSLGDSIIVTFVSGIQFLPASLMFVQLCPNGQEGLAYSLLTGFQNLAGGVSATISNLLLGIWPVQLEDLKSGEFGGVWKLTLVANAINFLPLPFLFLLPKGRSEVNALQNQPLSRYAGKAMVVVMIVASVWTVTVSWLAITNPCYEIVGGTGCEISKHSMHSTMQNRVLSVQSNGTTQQGFSS